jgi:hypothetical protein
MIARMIWPLVGLLPLSLFGLTLSCSSSKSAPAAPQIRERPFYMGFTP